MNKKEIEVVLQRIEKWYKSLYEMVVYDKITFEAEFGWTKDHVPFNNKESLPYKPIKEGEKRIVVSMVLCDICIPKFNPFALTYNHITNKVFYNSF